MNKLTPLRTVVFIVYLVLIWGINWPMTKSALSFTPPILFSGMRTLLGGLLLLLVALPRWRKMNVRRAWPVYLVSTLFNIMLYYGLQTIGLNYLPSGMFAVIVFLQPVLVGIFSWMWLGEAMNPLKMIGLLLGFAGVAVISAGGSGGPISPVGVLLAVGSAFSWAIGTVFVKKAGMSVALDSIWLVTLQLILGGICMMALGTGLESWSAVRWSGVFLFDVAFISIFVIAIGWWVFFSLIAAGEATKVASYTFLIPLVAIVIGVIFLREPFTSSLLAGLVLIVISILLVNRKPRKQADQGRKPFDSR